MGAGRAGRFSGLRRLGVGGLTDLLDVIGLALVALGVWGVLGIWFAVLVSGGGVLLLSRGLTVRAQRRKARTGSEVA